MQTLRELYEEIANNNIRWSYYQNNPQSIYGKWDNHEYALAFIERYFEFAGKSQAFKDEQLRKNRKFIENRATHIISTFLIGIKLAESFGVDISDRNAENMNFLYYWFLTCLYHDIGYAYEDKSNCEHLRMIQVDGLDAIHEICDIKYFHNRVFKTYSKEIIDFYFKCRSNCNNGTKGKIDHGIIGGLLLYDKLRKQFAIAWKRRTNKNDSRQSFYIKDECSNRELHLSNNHYAGYAEVADAIIAHNIWVSTLNEYINKYDHTNAMEKIENKISKENILCFILSIADTIEPVKRDSQYLDLVQIRSLENNRGIELQVDEITFDNVYKNIINLMKWVDVCVRINRVNGDVSIQIKKE